MAEVKLFIGGTPNPLYPNDGGHNQYREPHANRIAYEYATGEFTLGWPFNPKEQGYQRTELLENELAVGDTILLYVVPQEHLITSLLARVDDVDARFAGATLKPTAMLYDPETKEYTEVTEVTQGLENMTLVERAVNFIQIQGSQGVEVVPVSAAEGETVTLAEVGKQNIYAPNGYFVPTGKTLVLGFKVTALPTDTTQRFAYTQASASLVAKVSGFDIPTAV